MKTLLKLLLILFLVSVTLLSLYILWTMIYSDNIETHQRINNTSTQPRQDANENEYFGEEAGKLFTDNYNRLHGSDAYSRIEGNRLYILLIDISSKTCYYISYEIDDLYYKTHKKGSEHLKIIKNCNVEERFGVVRSGKWSKM